MTIQSCQTNAIGLSSTTSFPNHRFSASASFDFRYKPYEARFNTSWYGWTPTKADRSTCWLRIDIGSIYILCAISTLGSRYWESTEYVKKYKLKVTLNNNSWSSYMETGQEKIFEGNIGSHTVNKNVLSQAVRAKVIEIVPTDYNSYPTLRVELFGVVQPCASSLGIENGDIKDSQITPSSGSVSNCRLYNTGGSWCSSTQSNMEYIQVDLGKPGTVRGVATQGSANQNYWTKSFSVAFSYDNVAWYNFTDNGAALKKFSTAANQHTVRVNWFHNPFVARYVRIYPQTWNGKPCLRFDLYGCSDGNFPKAIVAVKGVGNTSDGNPVVELECHARGQPQPLVKWQQGVSDVSENVTVANNFDGSIVVRLRRVVLPKNCQKTNTSSRAVMCKLPIHTCVTSYPLQYGDNRPTFSSISSVKLDAPDVVEGLQVTFLQARSVKFAWIAPDPGSTYIVAYKLQFNGKNVNTTSDATFYLLTGLSPYTRYTVSIAAVSTLGDGLWTSGIHFRTAEGAPSHPNNLTVTAKSNIPSVVISWKKPTTPNGLIRHYSVYYRLLPTGTFLKLITVEANVTNSTLNVVGGLSYQFGVCATTVKEGPKATKNETIRDYAPEAAPSGFTLILVAPSTFNLSWSPPPRDKSHGTIIQYGVKLKKVSARRKRSTVSLLHPILNTSDTFALLTDLKLCENYNVSVNAWTRAGPGPYSVEYSFKYMAAPPQNVTVTKSEERSITLSWQQPADYNNKITGYRVNYLGVKSYNQSFHHLGTKKIKSTSSFTTTNLIPGTDYSFQLYAITQCGEDVYGSKVKATTKFDAPLQPALPNVLKGEKFGNTLVITIHPVAAQNGPISLYQVIVLRMANMNTNLPNDFQKNLYGFTEADNKGLDFYVSAEIPASKVKTAINFTIGDNQRYGNYVNFRFTEGKSYKVFVRVLTKVDEVTYAGNYSLAAEVTFQKAYDTSTEKSDIPTIVGIVLSLIVVLIIVICVVLFLRIKKRNRQKSADQPMSLQDLECIENQHQEPVPEEDNGNVPQQFNDNINQAVPLKGDGQFVQKSGPSSNGAAIYSNVLEDDEHKPIPVVQFGEYINRVKGANFARLRREYETFSKIKQFPWTVAEKPENKKYNRYRNIIAYDHSRVILDPPVDNVTYINANRIPGWDGTPNVYVATQGPVEATLITFWGMIWNEDVPIIIMVTNVMEGGKTKCHKYWPDDNMTYGPITVFLHKTQEFADYTIRTYLLKKGSENRTVLQFHFTVWPDHGVPRLPSSLLGMRRRVKAITPNDRGPIVVHCSAGVGRTGTYIVIDAMIEQARSKHSVDIYNYLQNIRKKRIHMVQTEEQYVFIHKAIHEYLTCGNTEINAQDLRLTMNKLATTKQGHDKTGFDEEFERLSFASPNASKDECEVAWQPTNINKSRNQNLMPLDVSRVLLKTHRPEDDYINASFVDAYKERDSMILTQAPLHNTIKDFWKMVYDYNVGTVVMLNTLDEEELSYPQYWPDSENTNISYEDINVQLTSQETRGDVILRYLTIKEKKSRNPPLKLRHLQHVAWPDHSVPANPQSVLNLVTMVTSALQQATNTTAVVQCSDGVGRSGTFGAIYSILERVKMEQVVDVFQAVKAIRVKRPLAVETLVQYKFCYKVVETFLDSFSNYANFSDC